MITKDLGAVSAYAYAVEKGYTGTEAEYAELMASYATVAQQASQSAQTASEKAQQASASATSASQSATTATAKASEAQQSATTATTKAQEASQSASESSQSASTAVQAKQDAQTAKTASETAQGLAESARDSAITAKTSAESARDEAQEIVDGITGKVEQIDSNTERIESLEDDRYKPYPTDTASGSVASFPDGADNIPLKSCIVQIEPVQAGSGDPSPDNIRPITGWTGANVQRTGENISPVSTIVGADWAYDLKYYPNNGKLLLDRLNSLPEGQYTISWKIIVTSVESQFTSEIATATTNRVMILHKYGRIEGEGNEITRSQALAHYQSSKAFSIIITPQMVGNFTDFYLYGLGRNVATEGAPNGVLGTADYYDIQLELGSTATDYEPYTGNLYPITFPTEAGTVYGGYIDPINGELVTCPYYASYNGETLTGEWISDRDKYVAGTTPTIGAQVVNIGAVGETYPLTPTEIKTLLGQNNLWADTGDTEIEYRADVKLYINKKIAEAISALS